jgi:hypothetical protein
MKQKDWFVVLSARAKAEILSGVLHELENLPEVLEVLPERYIKKANRALADCSIPHDNLRKRDLRAINEWGDQWIDTSDIPELTREQFAGAERARFYRPLKRPRVTRPSLKVVSQIPPGKRAHYKSKNKLEGLK